MKHTSTSPPISLSQTITTIMNNILSTSEVLGEELDIGNETYGPIYNFIKTRGFYGSKQREVIIRKAELIEEKSDFISTTVRLVMNISRHEIPSDLRMACIVLACCKYVSTNNEDQDHMKNIVQSMEEKLARDASRRSIIKEEERIEKASLELSHQQEVTKMREAEAGMRGAEASMRESETRMLEAEYSMRITEASMREAEASAKIAEAESQTPPPVLFTFSGVGGDVDEDTAARDKDLFDNLYIGVNDPDLQVVKPTEPEIVGKSRKVMDGTMTIVEPTKKRKLNTGNDDIKKKYKSHVVSLEPAVILGDITAQEIPYSKSDRLAQVSLAISETGGGMERVFSSVWGLVSDMREEKRKYNATNSLFAPGPQGVNDLVVRINLNNMLYKEKYLPLRQYIGQSQVVDEKFIQNAFSLVSKQTGKFQKSFPTIMYCKLGTQSKSQGALVIDMSR